MRPGQLTPPDRLACTSLTRVMEGIRLWRGIPGSKLLLSGGRYSRDVMSSAEGMAILARDLGVPAEAMVLESQSRDTREEARLLRPILGTQPFALVTSASHMMRSLMDFRKEGLEPIPAPADFEAARFSLNFSAFIPSSHSLEKSRKAIHEYPGHAGESRSKMGIRISKHHCFQADRPSPSPQDSAADTNSVRPMRGEPLKKPAL